MNIKALIAGCASVALLSGVSAASAADIVTHRVIQRKVPVVIAPSFDWCGAYAGIQAGGTWAKTKVTQKSSDTEIKDLFKDPSAFDLGLFAGYNMDLGNNIIAGIDTDIAFAITKDEKDKETKAEKDIQNFKPKWIGATRARLGYAVDRFLPYVDAGISYAGIKIEAADNTSENKTRTGWTAGVGFDYAFTNNVLLRAEYRYNDLGKFDDLSDAFKDKKVEYKTNDVRVGVAYKF